MSVRLRVGSSTFEEMWGKLAAAGYRHLLHKGSDGPWMSLNGISIERDESDEMLLGQLAAALSYLVDGIVSEEWLALCAFVQVPGKTTEVGLVSFPSERWGEIKDALEEVLGRPLDEMRVQ